MCTTRQPYISNYTNDEAPSYMYSLNIHSCAHTSSSVISWSSPKMCVFSLMMEIFPVSVWQETSPLYSISGRWPNGSFVTPAISHVGPWEKSTQVHVISMCTGKIMVVEIGKEASIVGQQTPGHHLQPEPHCMPYSSISHLVQCLGSGYRCTRSPHQMQQRHAAEQMSRKQKSKKISTHSIVRTSGLVAN